MRVWIVCLLLGLSGCLQGDEAADAPDPDVQETPAGLVEPRSLDWALEDCVAILTMLPASAQALAPYMPPGFTPLPLLDAISESDLPLDPVDGNIGVETMDCASGTGRNGTVQGMTYGSIYTMVEPPEELRRDVTFHFLKWDVLIPDDDRRDLLTSWGVPARSGTVQTDLFEMNGDLKLGDQTLDLGGQHHRIVANSALPYAKTEGSIAEFTPVDGGFVTWQTDFAFHSVANGGALVEVAPGDMLAEVVGSGPVLGASFVGHLSFTGGTITAP